MSIASLLDEEKIYNAGIKDLALRQHDIVAIETKTPIFNRH